MSKLFSELMEKHSPSSQPAPKSPAEGRTITNLESKTSRSEPAAGAQEKKESKNASSTPRYRDTTIPSNQDVLIETIRKAVRQLGKEAATYRFTPEEKRALADIVYTYKASGVRTSENEITRIAIHTLIEDYRATGKVSILVRVLERLNE
jgi:hypothetical protein